MKSVISVVKNRRFDYKLLSEFIVKKQISLSEDYSKIKLTRDTFQVGLLDGASDAIIDGLNYFYKAEKGTEYFRYKTKID
jgi:hypothetical protein